jgi:hypothetical protein
MTEMDGDKAAEFWWFGIFSQWEIHSKHGESCRESVLFFGDGGSRINHNVLFFAGVSLSKFPSFVDLNIHRFWLLKPIILGDARLMNWWTARVMFLWFNFVVQKCYHIFSQT